ncbi:MAG: hypothetical protein ABI606_22845 [Rhodoferax sp.]
MKLITACAYAMRAGGRFDTQSNGLIDSGRELFGDSTILQNGPKAGQTAANGYEALADLDANADGKINSGDAAYGQLRIWQDGNQDGISQAGELHTLGQLGIASINVTGAASSVNLGNGNTQPLSGGFTRTDGSNGASGVAELSGSLLLANNNFYREFSDDPAIAVQEQGLRDRLKCKVSVRLEKRIRYKVSSCSCDIRKVCGHKSSMKSRLVNVGKQEQRCNTTGWL